MTMACGLDLHRRQITLTRWTSSLGRRGLGGCGSPIGSVSGVGSATMSSNALMVVR